MANLTRINNNQITDAVGGNTQLGINANTKVQDYSLTSQKIANNLTYGSDLTISGNLTVMGNTTQIDTTVVSIEDPMILLASNQIGTPTVDIGYIGQRGTANNIAFVWDESLDKFVTVFTDSGAGDVNINILDYANLLTGNLSVVDLISTVNISLTGNVLGDLNITGNGIASNFYTVGSISATGLITGGNIKTAGNVSATGNIFGNAILADTLSLSGNVFSPLNVTGNLTAGNIFTPGQVSVNGNVRAENFLADTSYRFTGSNITITENLGSIELTPDATINGSGVIIGGNGYLLSSNSNRNAELNYNNINGQLGINQANVYGNSLSTSYTTGAVIIDGQGGLGVGGNIYANGLTSVLGNVIAGNVNTVGLVTATGNVTGGNVNTAGIGAFSNGLDTQVLINPNSIEIGKSLRANAGTTYIDFHSGNAGASDFDVRFRADGGTNVDGQGNLTVYAYTTVFQGNVSTTGNSVTVGDVSITGAVSVSGNIYGNSNIAIAGYATVTGNVSAANVNTSGIVTATGNIYTANSISAVGLITAVGNVIAGNLVTDGIANVYTLQVNENANISGYASVIGNIYGNNISANYTVSSTNVVATYMSASGNVDASNVSVVGNVLTSNVVALGTATVTGNITGGNLNTAGTANVFTLQVNGNANVDGYTSVVGNILGNNIIANYTVQATNVIASYANVSGNVDAGNVSVLGNVLTDNVVVTSTATVTGNITGGNLVTAGMANVYTLQVNGNAAVAGYTSVIGNIYSNNISANYTVSTTNVIASYASVSGNVDAGNVSVVGNVLTDNVVVTSNATVSGNVTAANFKTSGTQGNITGANVISAITFTASGNVVGNNLISINDTNVNANLSVTANVTGGNLNIITDTILSNLSLTGTAKFDTTVSVTGNLTAGNVNTVILNATGNVYGNVLSAQGNIITGVAGAVNAFKLNTATILSANALNISTTNSAISFNTGTANVNFNGAVLNNIALPQQANDAANKAYVDATAQGLSPKDSCDVGTDTYLANTAMTTNVVYYNGAANDGVGATLTVTTTSFLYLDGISLEVVYLTKGAASRVLIKNEGTQGSTTANGAWNGIYNITSISTTQTVLTRSLDFDTPAEVYSAYVFVQQGSTLADTSWTCTNNATAPVTIGTTFINWTQFAGAGTYTAGAGLSLNGTVFNVLVDNVTTSVNGSNQVIVLANAQIAAPNIGNATFSSLTWTGAGSANIAAGNISLTGGIQAITDISTTGNIIADDYASANAVYVTGLGNTGVVFGATTANGTQLVQDNSFLYNTANSTLLANNLIIANSITTSNITDTSISQYSVLFAGVGGLVTQDNANLTYNETTGVLKTVNMSATGYVSAAGNVFGNRVYATGMTPSQVTYISTDGIIEGNASLTFSAANTTLTANNINVSTMLTSANITDTAISQYSVIFAGTGGLLTQDNANLTYTETTGVLKTANMSATGYVSAAGNVFGNRVYATGMTPNSVPFIGSSGLMDQSVDLTYEVANTRLIGNNVNVTTMLTSANITDTALSQYSVIFTGPNGLLVDDNANLTYNKSTTLLTVPNISATGFVSATGNVYGNRLFATGMTPNSVTFISTSGILEQSTELTYETANTRLIANNVNVSTMLTSANITDTALSQHSVIFTGPGGLLTQDNANFTFTQSTGVLLATNLSTTGNVTATGNISGNNVFARTLNANSVVFAGADGLLTQSANITYNSVANVLNLYSISAVATITANNFVATGNASSTGNITAANLITSGNVFLTSEYSGLQFPGGGSVTEAGPVDVQIQGPDQVIVLSGNTYQWTYGNTGILSSPGNTTTLANTGISTAGNVSVTGNVNSGLNLRATATTLNDTGNGAWGGTITGAGNVVGFFHNGSGNSMLTLAANTGVMSLQIDGSIFIGDSIGSNPYTIEAGYAGWLVAGAGIKSFGDMDSDANIHGNYITANNTVFTTDVSASGNVYTDGFISVTGNIISNASILGNVFSATGNIFAAGYVSITGNIVSNASILGNVFSASGNINTAANISASGNITAVNVVTSLAANIGNINIQDTTITTTSSDPLYINNVGSSIDFGVNGPVANLLFVSGIANSVTVGSNLLTDGATFAVNASDSMVVPVGNSYQRPVTPATGMFRWNTTIESLEAYSGSAWQTVGTPDFTLITNEQFYGDGITLSYNLTGNGLSTNACIVTINGVVQIPVTAYAVVGTPTAGSTLTFTEAPQTGDVIDVREITSTKTVNGIGGNGQAGISVVNNDLVATGNIVPSAGLTYSLGNAARPWNSLYVAGNTIYLGSMQLKAYGNTFGVYDSANNLATINAGNLAVDSINYGNTTIGIPVESGNAVITVNNNTITTFAETGVTIFGTLSAQGTTTLANVTATGNIIAADFLTSGLVSATGNITGGNIMTDGMISTSGRIVSNTNILAATVSVTGALAVGTFANVTGNINGGNVSTPGRLSVGGNVYGNVAQFYGTSGTGNSAIYAGLNTGFATLPNVVVQTSTSANSYTQFNSQNINTGTQSSTEYVATASNGDDTNNFIDMGIAGGNWDTTQPNSLGNAVLANDGFLYVQGGTGGGNLVLATSSADKAVKIVTGGPGAANLVATFNNRGTVSANTTSGALVVTGGLGVSGTINANSLGVTTLSVAGLTMTGNTIVSAGVNLTLDPNGSGSTDGNVIIAGNLQVQGTTTTINSNTVSINDLVFNVANNASTGSQANGGGLGVGPVGAEYATLTYNNASNIWGMSLGVSINGIVTAVGNVTAPNYLTGGLVSATGNVRGGNLVTTGTISTSGSVFGAVANITAYTGGTMTLTGNITGGNIGGTNLSGTLIAGPQTGINAVGTLVSLSVTGNVTGGNIFTNGTVSSAGNITANVYIGNGAALTGVVATGVGTLTNLTVTGNVVAGNLRSAGLSLSGTITSDLIPAANVTYSLGNTTNRWKDLWISNSTIYLGNTTLGATSTGLTVNGVDVVTTTSSGPISTTGNVTSGNVVATGAITIGSAGVTTAIVNGGTSGVGNIGTAATPFNMVYALATSAQYADLAEKYTADAEYAPGTVVAFGGEAEVTASTADSDRRVAGVVSTNPSYIMNGSLTGEHVVTVALTGRVPCRVTGPVRKGDLMVSNGDGTARADTDPKVGTVIGKALADHASGVGVIEVVVGRV